MATMHGMPECRECSFHNQEGCDRRYFRNGVCDFCRKKPLERALQRPMTAAARVKPEGCLMPSSVAALQRSDIPPDIEQVLIIRGNKAFLQGQAFDGELCVNTVALQQDSNGPVVFMLKLQDRLALSHSAADNLVEQILAVAPHCPAVPRGNGKTALHGWMKCLLERFSRCAGEFGRTRAEQLDNFVADLADAILDGQIDAVSLAFPHQMNQAYRRIPASDGLGQFYNGKWNPFSHVSITGGNYASPPHIDEKDIGMNFIIWYLSGRGAPPKGDVFHFDDLNLSFTPRHGTMLAFEPAATRHSTAVPHTEHAGCQRIGSAISLQRNALYKAINAHADIKKQQAHIQSLQLQLVKARMQLGLKKNGEAKEGPAMLPAQAGTAKRRKLE